MRVLLVDDEPLVRSTLERLLRASAPALQLTAAADLDEALGYLRDTQFDVVLEEASRAGRRGPPLLQAVRASAPNALRVAFSGHIDAGHLVPIFAAAHRHLAKPLRLVQLQELFERLRFVQGLVGDAAFSAVVSALDELPPMPRTYSALLRALSMPTASAKDVARIIEVDSALTAKLLRLVSSSFFGRSGTIGSVERAVVLVGTNVVKASALAIETFELAAVPDATRVRMQRHALLTANLAARIAGRTGDAEHGFAAGLLHDVGELVLAATHPEHFRTVCQRAQAEQRASYEVEREIGEPAHTEVGAYLLGLWGLPQPIIEAVLHHQGEPTEKPRGELDLAGAVCLADILASEQRGDGVSQVARVVDEEALTTHFGAQRVQRWRDVAVEEAQRIDEIAL